MLRTLFLKPIKWSGGIGDWSGEIEDDESLEDGFVTAEYAVGILAAVGFAGVLLAVLKSSAVRQMLTAIITSALNV